MNSDCICSDFRVICFLWIKLWSNRNFEARKHSDKPISIYMKNTGIVFVLVPLVSGWLYVLMIQFSRFAFQSTCTFLLFFDYCAFNSICEQVSVSVMFMASNKLIVYFDNRAKPCERPINGWNGQKPCFGLRALD